MSGTWSGDHSGNRSSEDNSPKDPLGELWLVHLAPGDRMSQLHTVSLLGGDNISREIFRG